MKMVMVIMPESQADYVLNALIIAGHAATYTETKGGMLRKKQTTIFAAVQEDNLEEVLEIIEGNCRVEVSVIRGNPSPNNPQDKNVTLQKKGGAIVFIWDLFRMENY
ncbi:MAG: cyclic-di-AMP receptor [Anaerolineaceae bacterium]|nr:cyclic-di-AMP receptor [Anaerolineaceae bacterium]